MIKRLKRMLMIQSLSPLALLTIIRNFSFTLPVNEFQSLDEMIVAFIKDNRILIVVMILCLIWIIAAMFSYFSFSAFRWTDKKRGFEIKNVHEEEDASLNFFMTMIIPLLIDDVYTPQGALTFAIIVVLMCALLEKTKLFYANPVLSLLGYRIYTFSFVENSTYGEKTCIGVVQGKLRDHPGSIEFKSIDGNVLYVKEITR